MGFFAVEMRKIALASEGKGGDYEKPAVKREKSVGIVVAADS